MEALATKCELKEEERWLPSVSSFDLIFYLDSLVDVLIDAYTLMCCRVKRLCRHPCMNAEKR